MTAPKHEPDYTLKPITGHGIKVYTDMGLDEPSGEFIAKWGNVAKNDASIKELAMAICVGDFTNVDGADIDREKMLDAICFFGERGLALTRGFMSTRKHS